MSLRDRVAIVTGGANGIGEGIVVEFAREGATVVVADIDDAGSQEVERKVRAAGGQAVAIRCDVSQADEVERLVRSTVDRFGRLDILVNNAAMFVYTTITDTVADDFDRSLSVNLRGALLCTQQAAPHLAASEHPSVINIASVHAVQNVGGTVPYATAKGGIAAMTRAAAIDLAPQRIRVNAICPGWVDTALVRDIFERSGDAAGMRRDVEQRQLLKRLGTPRDIGRAAVFLAGDDSSYMTGSQLFVDAGMTAQLETWF